MVTLWALSVSLLALVLGALLVPAACAAQMPATLVREGLRVPPSVRDGAWMTAGVLVLGIAAGTGIASPGGGIVWRLLLWGAVVLTVVTSVWLFGRGVADVVAVQHRRIVPGS